MGRGAPGGAGKGMTGGGGVSPAVLDVTIDMEASDDD
jgi:hypothetical protein